jgi:hypothetical protein
MRTNTEIVALAQLTLEVDQSPQDEALAHHLESGQAQLGGAEGALPMMAVTLLEDAETARCARSLAEHLGAITTENDPNDPWADAFSQPRHNLRPDPPKRAS